MNTHKIDQTAYWNQSSTDVLNQVQSDEHGLTTDEALKRLLQYGHNTLAQKRKIPDVVRFLSKFFNPLVLILLFASVISAIFGEITNLIIVSAIIIISSAIDFYQEHHAEKAEEALKQKVSLTATVLRDGQYEEINTNEITVGDIIGLAAGDLVPADARLLQSRNLLVNQSSLTGESFPQEKHITIAKEHSSVAERTNTVFMGTSVLSGEAVAVVVRVGSNTELGSVANELVLRRPETEFQKGIRQFGYLLMKTTLVLVIIVFFINAYFKQNVIESFLFALALAVGLTPELLPMIITVNLSRGALRMSKKEVIVKDLPAIQNLGSMTILCTDKTGTLTEDKIKLERYENIHHDESHEVLTLGYVNSLHQSGLKSPLDHAILAHHEVDHREYSEVDEIPFDFERRRLSVVVKHRHNHLLITKGAPEHIVHLATHYGLHGAHHILTDKMRKDILKRFESLSAEGFRVLAIATRAIKPHHRYTPADEKELVYVGLMAFLDPAKESAKEALQLLEKQGIVVKILTGDNEIVTKKICDDLGLKVTNLVLGSHIEHMDEKTLAAVAARTTIFARLDPNQKTKVIIALKNQGAVVGFLGDGINDAPSLRAADVGISVNNAVDVAKESADMILLRKDLHILKDGVYEGRKTYANSMKYIMMGTSSNFGNMFSVAGASIFLPFLPMLPIQILLNNLLYDLSQLAIPTDSIDQEALNKPRQWDLRYIKHFMLVFGPLSSLFDFLTFFILLLAFHASVGLFQTGWFMESLLTQSLIIFSIRTVTVPFYKSKASQGLIISSGLVALAALLVPLSPLASVFSFIPPPVEFYLVLVFIVICYFIVAEYTKQWFYRKYTS